MPCLLASADTQMPLTPKRVGSGLVLSTKIADASLQAERLC